MGLKIEFRLQPFPQTPGKVCVFSFLCGGSGQGPKTQSSDIWPGVQFRVYHVSSDVLEATRLHQGFWVGGGGA